MGGSCFGVGGGEIEERDFVSRRRTLVVITVK